MAQVLVTTESGEIIAQWDEVGTSMLSTESGVNPDFAHAIKRAEAKDAAAFVGSGSSRPEGVLGTAAPGSTPDPTSFPTHGEGF